MIKFSILIVASLVTIHLDTESDHLYMISTSVEIRDGQIDKVLDLFKTTNPTLVQDQKDWVSAQFSADITNNKVLVTAYWKSESSYKVFSQSDKFRKTMSLFEPYFVSQPEISITQVLFEM